MHHGTEEGIKIHEKEKNHLFFVFSSFRLP